MRPGTIASSQEWAARTSELCHEYEGAEAKPPLARAIDAALPRGRNVTVAPGGASPVRGIAYNTRMNRLFDKSIVLACCIAAATGLAVDARLVAAFCLGVVIAALAEVAQGERARRASEAGSYAYVIAAVFVPPFVPFAPLALYDIARRVRRERIWPALAIGSVFACALATDLRCGALTTRTLLLTAILSVAATLLSLRTAQLEREQERMRRTRDKLQERALALEARNRDLADRQDYEVELATLAERARIAREIHDNVGHQLTRASLQTEALRVVHANEPGVAADFADVKYTVDEALQLVRASVHALNDNAVDLSVQLERIVEGARSDGGPRIELEVMTEHAPANVAHCFAAGASTSDSESRLFVGGAGDVPTDVFSPCDYAALGHLHAAQRAGDTARYAGSPLKYSVDEAHQKKSMTLVTLGDTVETTCIPVTPLHDVKRIEGTFAALLENGQAAPNEDYVEILLTDDEPVFRPADRLRPYYPNVLGVRSTWFLKQHAGTQAEADLHSRSRAELFRGFLKEVCGEEAQPEDEALLAEILKELEGDAT